MCLWGADYKRGIILFKIYKHMFYFFTQRKTPRTWCREPAEYLRAAGKHTWLPPQSSPGPSAKTFPNPSGGSEVSQGELSPWPGPSAAPSCLWQRTNRSIKAQLEGPWDVLGTDGLAVKAEAWLAVSHLRDFPLLRVRGHCPHWTNEGTEPSDSKARRQRPELAWGCPRS